MKWPPARRFGEPSTEEDTVDEEEERTEDEEGKEDEGGEEGEVRAATTAGA